MPKWQKRASRKVNKIRRTVGLLKQTLFTRQSFIKHFSRPRQTLWLNRVTVRYAIFTRVKEFLGCQNKLKFNHDQTIIIVNLSFILKGQKITHLSYILTKRFFWHWKFLSGTRQSLEAVLKSPVLDLDSVHALVPFNLTSCKWQDWVSTKTSHEEFVPYTTQNALYPEFGWHVNVSSLYSKA